MDACNAEYLKKRDVERGEREGVEKPAKQFEHDWLASVNALYPDAEQHTWDIAPLLSP